MTLNEMLSTPPANEPMNLACNTPLERLKAAVRGMQAANEPFDVTLRVACMEAKWAADRAHRRIARAIRILDGK